ncbi:MAG: phenylalanine--tRNA ligase subunit alpha [Euryarchaeota archaeon]|nr:phenylalanine--tRNA ligase subunit alpha [Euryarchaeota archaeon]
MDLSINEVKLLKVLKNGTLSPEAASMESNLGEKETMSAASWLRSKGLVKISESSTKFYFTNEEGKRYAEQGLPERRAVEWLNQAGESLLSELPLHDDESKVVIGWLKRKMFANLEKTDEGLKLIPTGNVDETSDEPLLVRLSKSSLSEKEIDQDALNLLKGRQLLSVKEEVERTFSLTDEGNNFNLESLDENLIGDITPDLIHSGEWKDRSFQRYGVEDKVEASNFSTLHPLTRFTEEIRSIFLQMGFTEIEGDYVESAFWNMDALFIPQDHPARELQDTFYLSEPASFVINEKEILDAVKKIHEDGGETGSKGWGTDWSKEAAQQALLRTHTTVGTIRYLAENPTPPARVFSVGRVFRREALDSTHLPEFTQVEGIIVEPDANFGMLIGVLKEFYRRMGFNNVRVRPAYFPYTEPSLEVEVKFGDKWLELGGAGIFRPEVTAPFGIDCPVLAWGLGLERLAMLHLEIKDIRMLYQSDLKWLKETL